MNNKTSQPKLTQTLLTEAVEKMQRKRAPRPIPALSPDTTSGDLLERYKILVDQLARARAAAFPKAEASPLKPLLVRRAQFFNLSKAVADTRVELLHRLGVLLSPEITNRAAFMYLSRMTRSHGCMSCGSKGFYGKTLEFWTPERNPEPLPRMMAWSGADAAKVKDVLESSCVLLCSKCSRKRGAKLTRQGKADLTQYGVEIR